MPYDTYFSSRKGRRYIPDPFGRLTPPVIGKDKLLSNLGGLFGFKQSVGMEGRNRRRDVARAETLLGSAGYLDLDETDGPTGYFGARTDEAVKWFQKDNGLKRDGLINPDGPTLSTLRQKIAPMAAESAASGSGANNKSASGTEPPGSQPSAKFDTPPGKPRRGKPEYRVPGYRAQAVPKEDLDRFMGLHSAAGPKTRRAFAEIFSAEGGFKKDAQGSSAYGGMTDAGLETAKKSQPGLEGVGKARDMTAEQLAKSYRGYMEGAMGKYGGIKALETFKSPETAAAFADPLFQKGSTVMASGCGRRLWKCVFMRNRINVSMNVSGILGSRMSKIEERGRCSWGQYLGEWMWMSSHRSPDWRIV